MSAVNTIMIMGRLTREPELKTVGEGDKAFNVARFSVAVNRQTKKDHPEADFFNVEAFRGKADLIAQYFHKGSRILVKGEMRFDNYQDADGNERKAAKIVLDDFGFVDTKAESTSNSETETKPVYSTPDVSADDSDEPW